MQLPNRPNLRHLANQAKALRQAHRNGDPQAAERLKANLPRFANLTPDAILAADLSLQETQHVLAKEYGFAQWKELSEYVKALTFPKNSVFSNDPDGWLEKAEEEEFWLAVEAHATNKGIIRKQFDRAVHHNTYQVRYTGVTSVPLWDTAEERETGNSYKVNHSIVARERAYKPQPETERSAAQNQLSPQEIVRAVHQDFSHRIAAVLTRLTLLETSAELFSTANTTYAALASDLRDGDMLAYRFVMQPGGLALMLVGVPSMCSFIGKPFVRKERHTGLSPDEHVQALGLVRTLLDALEHSWAAHRPVRFAAPELCQKEYRALDLDFEDRLAKVELVVQSSQVSRELGLYYANPLLH